MRDVLVVLLVVAVLFVGPTVLTRLVVVLRAARSTADPELRRSLLRAPLHLRFYRVRLRLPWYPTDPYQLGVPVEVLPFGDGRPGERLRLPCRPARRQGVLGPDGSRTDVEVQVSPDLWFAVVCLGRVGWVHRDDVLTAAPVRVVPRPGPVVWEQPVREVMTPIGPAWRRTAVLPTGSRLTDIHLDHDGWAYVIGVRHAPLRLDAERFRDTVLSTWTWIEP